MELFTIKCEKYEKNDKKLLSLVDNHDGFYNGTLSSDDGFGTLSQLSELLFSSYTPINTLP